jgi:hypothetical protein
MTTPALHVTRRDVLKNTLMIGSLTALSLAAFAQQPVESDGTRSEAPSALALARWLTRTKFADLPPKAVNRRQPQDGARLRSGKVCEGPDERHHRAKLCGRRAIVHPRNPRVTRLRRRRRLSNGTCVRWPTVRWGGASGS